MSDKPTTRKPTTRERLRQAPAAARQQLRQAPAAARAIGGQTVSAGQSTLTLVQQPVERRGRSVGWAIIGYTLLLVLIYILLKPKVTSALSTLVQGGSNALSVWVKPEDPIAKLESTLGSGAPQSGVSSSGASTSTANSTEQNTIATAEMVLNGPGTAPSPAAAGAAGVAHSLPGIEKAYGTPAELRRKLRVLGSANALVAPRPRARTLQPLVVAQ